MSMVFDEYGRPFIILKESENQERIQGKKARKQNILAARSIANIMKSSLGPKGALLPPSLSPTSPAYSSLLFILLLYRNGQDPYRP